MNAKILTWKTQTGKKPRIQTRIKTNHYDSSSYKTDPQNNLSIQTTLFLSVLIARTHDSLLLVIEVQSQ